MIFLHVNCGFSDWQAVGQQVKGKQIGAALQHLFHPGGGPSMFVPLAMAAMMFIACFLLLAWPARRGAAAPAKQLHQEMIEV